MILARCPACSTTFRVRPEQLRARQGRVRCGQCQHAFNALETLVEESPLGDEFAGSPLAAAEGLSPSPLFVLEEKPAEAAQPALSGGADDFRPAAEEAIALPAGARHLTTAPTWEPAWSQADDFDEGGTMQEWPPVEPPAQDATSAAPPLPPPAPQPAEIPAEGPIDFDALIHTRDHTEAVTPPVSPVPWPMPLPASSRASEAAPMAPQAEADEVDGESDEALPADEEDNPPALRQAAWSAVATLLLLAFVGQGLLVFRTDIAQSSPQTRPFLEGLCAGLGCELPLPHDAAEITIESSDIQPDATREAFFTLHATLRNRAEFQQAWPYLEITLTDARDKALVRRVLEPAQWLPANAPRDAFPARREVLARVGFEAPGVAAAGYRVYAFYP